MYNNQVSGSTILKVFARTYNQTLAFAIKMRYIYVHEHHS